MLKSIWRFLASVRLSVYLLFLVAFNLAIGSFYIQFNPGLFRPLNNMLLQDWLTTYQTVHCWWLITLLFLLFFLGVNTAICTAERLRVLWRKRRSGRLQQFLVEISPSLMHLFFLIALSGHCMSLFMGEQKHLPVIKGEQIQFSSFSIQAGEPNIIFWGQEALKNSIKQYTVPLFIQTPLCEYRKELGLLRPFFLGGWSFHLDMTKEPNSTNPLIQIIIKKDHGHIFILVGGGLLSLLMVWYFLQPTKNKVLKNYN